MAKKDFNDDLQKLQIVFLSIFMTRQSEGEISLLQYVNFGIPH